VPYAPAEASVVLEVPGPPAPPPPPPAPPAPPKVEVPWQYVALAAGIALLIALVVAVARAAKGGKG
jgi:hypothetical protein